MYSEQVSATDMEACIEWKRLMQSLQAGDVVTITKIDQAARNIADMVNITKALADIRHGWSVYTAARSASRVDSTMVMNGISAYRVV